MRLNLKSELTLTNFKKIKYIGEIVARTRPRFVECYLLPGQVWTPRLPEPLCCHVTERPHWGGVPCLPEQAAGRRAGRCSCPLTADLVQGLE